MKKYRFHILSLLIIVSLQNITGPVAFGQIDSFTRISQLFRHPPRQYGSAPLWVWNDDVSEQKISSMLKSFKVNGFGAVFIHPRAGLITPYLSQDWLNLYAYTLKEAKKNNLDVWIYDEDSYPSGFAGGHVPDNMPASYDQGQMLQLDKAKVFPDSADHTYLICLKKKDSLFININNSIAAEKGKKGDYYLFRKRFYYSSPWYGGFSYVDLMAKGVTEKFIEQTMSGYESEFGGEFGKTIPGIFSDEPNIEVQYPGNIRWTPDLFSSFKENRGYDLEINLPSLFEQTGDWKKVRHDYFQTLLQLFIDRWSKPFAAYTQKKNLEWTGHYWEHEWPSPNHVPDNMAMYAWPQRPGIDMLFNQFDEESPNAQFGNIRSVKELASVANQLNKKRTLSETYGGGGWELRFQDMKRLGDWEFVLGINTLTQHLSFMTIMGARKYDYPQSFSYHEPWWPYYKQLNEYFARLSLVLANGRQKNKILIIEPTTTAWMYFNYDNPDPHFSEIGKGFQNFITQLEKTQVEYDLGSENIIKDHGSVRNRQFLIGSGEYETVVLPPGMENIDLPTFNLLEKYAESGGRILQFSRLATIDGTRDKRIDNFYSKSYRGLKSFDSLDKNIIRQFLSDENFSIRADGVSKGDLYHQRRQLKDGEFLFLTNADLEYPASGSIQCNGKDVLLMDPFTGEIFSYPVKIKDKKSLIDFTIPPAGSQLFFISNVQKRNVKHISSRIGANEKVLSTSATLVKRQENNSLMIDFCDLSFGQTLLKEQHVYNATDTLFKFYGFRDGNPWNTSIQYKNRTILRDTFSNGTGFTATYYFNILDSIDLNTLEAVVERPGLWRVKVNDNEIKPQEDKWWLDKSFKVFKIGAYARIGQNKLSLVADKMSVHAEIEPIYILGNFSLSSGDKGWNILHPSPLKIGSWKEQGMPMYSREVNYTKKISIHKQAGKEYIVQLGKWEGTVCAIAVNNVYRGTVAYPPYQADISPWLNNGSNTIEIKVIGSLKNLLGPHHNKPKPGLVSPWHWRYVVKYPPGKEYDTYDYGLTEDFRIIEKE
jgi:alpha-L-rhamnosidase